MAVNDLNKKLKALAIPASKQALDAAQWRRENRDWLRKSFEISIHVLAAIKARGWNQKQLAEAMDVSQQQVSKIVKGQENMTLLTISKIESVLDIRLLEVNSVWRTAQYEMVDEFDLFYEEPFQVKKREFFGLQVTQELSPSGEPDEPNYTPRPKSTLGIAA